MTTGSARAGSHMRQVQTNGDGWRAESSNGPPGWKRPTWLVFVSVDWLSAKVGDSYFLPSVMQSFIYELHSLDEFFHCLCAGSRWLDFTWQVSKHTRILITGHAYVSLFLSLKIDLSFRASHRTEKCDFPWENKALDAQNELPLWPVAFKISPQTGPTINTVRFPLICIPAGQNIRTT